MTNCFSTCQLLLNTYPAIFKQCCTISKQYFNSLIKDAPLCDSYIQALKS